MKYIIISLIIFSFNLTALSEEDKAKANKERKAKIEECKRLKDFCNNTAYKRLCKDQWKRWIDYESKRRKATRLSKANIKASRPPYDIKNVLKKRSAYRLSVFQANLALDSFVMFRKICIPHIQACSGDIARKCVIKYTPFIDYFFWKDIRK